MEESAASSLLRERVFASQRVHAPRDEHASSRPPAGRGGGAAGGEARRPRANSHRAHLPPEAAGAHSRARWQRETSAHIAIFMLPLRLLAGAPCCRKSGRLLMTNLFCQFFSTPQEELHRGERGAWVDPNNIEHHNK